MSTPRLPVAGEPPAAGAAFGRSAVARVGIGKRVDELSTLLARAVQRSGGGDVRRPRRLAGRRLPRATDIGAARPRSAGTTTGGPGRYFVEHPALYRASLAGSGGTALYAAWRAGRAVGARRVPWAALAVLEGAIAAGIRHARASELPSAPDGSAMDRPRP